ncbi:6-phosphogluconolactonase [Catalinimonas alkaloidigena]|uniref:6-phosphogluconolactonase n=1 Tax=Catalinimonas alkaloidigena TaxID=1075417 RepID=A0A1G9HE51_9BACT|nr:lactonase family protein [Catalinimonas alkaloidigena]SDL11338.1 6-phosphogluconolactonase [Catalinimonas alkaloidigena]
MLHSSRRQFLKTSVLGAVGLSLPQLAHGRRPLAPYRFYVGTYTSKESQGIYLYELDPTSGRLIYQQLAARLTNPSYLAIDGQQRYLYAVNETEEFEGKPGGAVSAYAIDPATGQLTLLNQQPTRGGAPCYISVDQQNRYVLVANYVAGNVAVYPLQADGRLGAMSDLVQHTGSGPNPQRQQSPHAHCVLMDPTNQFAFAVDLGIDKIISYRLDATTGKLRPNAETQAAPGAGPRHLVFHPNGRLACVINELNSTLTSYRYNRQAGTLEAVQTVPTLPSSFNGDNSCADIHFDASGRFVYGSNRGHNSIVAYAIDGETGQLDYRQHISTQGQTPRNFAVDPSGKFLLAANQASDSIVTIGIDGATGQLASRGTIAGAPTPVCIRFLG